MIAEIRGLPPELYWNAHRLEAAKESDSLDPTFWEASAWLGHIPFAFWIVKAVQPRTIVELGTHWGHSYFAFCQAIADFGLDTKAFAVDSWTGDRHADQYGEQVFEDVTNWNSRYPFSSLLRTTFDEAKTAFEDGSIDLLHIDGLHTYDAVRHDFENWLPKISKQGVVLLHDIHEHKEDFGVWKLWSELQEVFPSFAFHHSHGLGVVSVGAETPAIVEFLVNCDDVDAERIRMLFEALGARFPHAALERRVENMESELEHRANVIHDLSRELNHRIRLINELALELEVRQNVIDDLAQEAAHRLNVIEGLIRERDHLSGRLTEDDSEPHR